MRPHERDAQVRGDLEMNISHFIPSVELRGSRAEKIAKLDTLIVHLEQLRRSLAGDIAAGRGTYEGSGLFVESPAWPSTGMLLGALFLLLLLVA